MLTIVQDKLQRQHISMALGSTAASAAAQISVLGTSRNMVPEARRRSPEFGVRVPHVSYPGPEPISLHPSLFDSFMYDFYLFLIARQ